MMSKIEELKQKLEKVGYEVLMDCEFMYVKLYTDIGGVGFVITDDEINYANYNIFEHVVETMNYRVKQYMQVKEEHRNE